jgi:crotonobetainyl-CoA:carnitine CoA-transferase CaiB-like acyl-CoA transferase
MAKWPKLTWDKEPTGPLKGIKVVDMATVVLGPYATVQLADLGAEVIKIENSEGNTPGDLMRHGGDSPSKQHGPIFTALNRNKKAINLNIKKPEDKAVLEALLEEADVFIHNVRMAGVERLGFGYEAVKAINPNIVYVHCAGFGAGGAYGERQAYDDLIQAASGFAALSEQRDGGRPTYSPSLVADKVSGLFAANATMAALLARAGGQGGQFVQVPMFECFTWFNMVENLWGETFIPGNGRMGYTRSSPIMTGNGRSFLNWAAGPTYSTTRVLRPIKSAQSTRANYTRSSKKSAHYAPPPNGWIYWPNMTSRR